MNQIATFEKVSCKQYIADRLTTIDLEAEGMTLDEFTKIATKEWEQIELPKRGTALSAGYDFHLPYSTAIGANPILIPTGIRCKIEPGWCLMLFPRSGLGFKYGMSLSNSVGIIDADYYHAQNEGHMMAKMYTRHKIACLEQGDRFMQGIFLPIGDASNGNSTEERFGGFGSTGK